MEDQAPYLTAAPPAPRCIAEALAEWLRAQGFTATVQHHDTMAAVQAHWTGERGERFELAYLWTTRRFADATCQFQARRPGLPTQNLFGAQRVRSLEDVQHLVLGNVRYQNARLLATLPHPAL